MPVTRDGGEGLNVQEPLPNRLIKNSKKLIVMYIRIKHYVAGLPQVLGHITVSTVVTQEEIPEEGR